MKRIWIWFFLLMLAAPLFGEGRDVPRLKCDQWLFEFGRVPQTAVITNVFTIRNENDKPFQVLKVRTLCSCTKATIDKKVIPSGGSAKVTAVFTAAGRKGPKAEFIFVFSDADPEDPAVVLRMNGFVVPPAEKKEDE